MFEDTQLVERSLEGDRDAFTAIVDRYKGVVSAVCYSWSGDLSLSEDLAQEAFIVSWKRLSELRDRSKLASWLCGIARNLSRNARRSKTEESARRSVSLHDAPQQATDAATPLEAAITREEQDLLWHTVEKLPETHREPLVLFYREGRSMKAVADALDISEEAARQRVSRARSMVKAEVSALVEGTLSRSRPSAALTVAVVAALARLSGEAAAATAGAATAATGLGASVSNFLEKSARFFFKFLLLPWIALRSTFLVRRELSEAKNASEKKVIIGFCLSLVLLPIVIFGGIVLVAELRVPLPELPLPFGATFFLLVLAGALALRRGKNRIIKRMRQKEGTWREPQRRTVTGAMVIFSIALCLPLVTLSITAYAADQLTLGAVFAICALIMLRGLLATFARAEKSPRHSGNWIWGMAFVSALFWSRFWTQVAEGLAGKWLIGGLAGLPLWGVVAFWVSYVAAMYVVWTRSSLSAD